MDHVEEVEESGNVEDSQSESSIINISLAQTRSVFLLALHSTFTAEEKIGGEGGQEQVRVYERKRAGTRGRRRRRRSKFEP